MTEPWCMMCFLKSRPLSWDFLPSLEHQAVSFPFNIHNEVTRYASCSEAAHGRPSGKPLLSCHLRHPIAVGIVSDCQQIEEYPDGCNHKADVDRAQFKCNDQLQ